MEPQNWWFVDVSPFPRVSFQVLMLVFGGYIFLKPIGKYDNIPPEVFNSSPLKSYLPKKESGIPIIQSHHFSRGYRGDISKITPGDFGQISVTLGTSNLLIMDPARTKQHHQTPMMFTDMFSSGKPSQCFLWEGTSQIFQDCPPHVVLMSLCISTSMFANSKLHCRFRS